MRKTIRAAVMAIALLPILSSAEEGDWGFAEVNFIKASLNDDFSVLSRSQFTWRDDFNDFYFWFADAGLAYSINPSWRIELAYRHAYWRFGDWVQERRPFVGANWSGTYNGIRLSNLARLEYRDFQWDRDDDFRFRNGTRAEFPWEILPGGIKPFLEEEFFYGNNRESIEMNWVTGGVYCKPAKGVKLKAGYRWIAIRVGAEGKWENRNQLVTGVALFF